MGEFVYDDAKLTVNAVDLSDHLRSSQLNGSADALDKTAMGQIARTFLTGLLNWSLSVEFNDDLAENDVDATLYAAFKARVAVAIAWRAVNDTISATNPEFQFNSLINAYNIGGSIGALAVKSLQWQVDGDVVRDVTA
jgi:hypothetical protein